MTRQFSFLGGFLLGSFFSLMILEADCQTAHMLLRMQVPRSGFLQGLFSVIKMGIYAMGFLIAVAIPNICNIFCVAIGYLTVKLTIYRLAFSRR